MFVKPSSLPEFESTCLLTIVEYRAAIGAREFNGAVDNGFQHHFQIKRRTHCAANLAQGSKVAIARLYLLKEPSIVNGYDSLIGECCNQIDLALCKGLNVIVPQRDEPHDGTIPLEGHR